MLYQVFDMSTNDLTTKLTAFASSASSPKQPPTPSPALNAVALATSGERIVLLDIGRTPLERVPGSSSNGSQRTTVMEAVLQCVQADFPGTACSIKGGASNSGCEMVLCFPNTAEGLRGFDWFHGQGKFCKMPLPDSDIAVHIPMKAFVSQPGVLGVRPVTMHVRDVPSYLWKDGLAAFLLQHFGIDCEVKAEYAPHFRLADKTYPGVLHKGVIKAELDPAPACDFSKLPKSVDIGGKLVRLQVYGHKTQPQHPPDRAAPPSPRAPTAATGHRHRARGTTRTRGNETQRGVQGSTPQETGVTREEDAPPAPPCPPAPLGPPPLQGGPHPASHVDTVHAAPHGEGAPPVQAPLHQAISETSSAAVGSAPPAPPASHGYARAEATSLQVLPQPATRTNPPAAADNTVATAPVERPQAGSVHNSPARGRKSAQAKPMAVPPATPPTRAETVVAGFESPNHYAPLASLATDRGDPEVAYPAGEPVTSSDGRRAPSARIAAQGRKNYADTGPTPVVSSGDRAAHRPAEPPIPGAV